MQTHEILTRGVQEVIPKQGLEELMGKRKIRVYMGIDPTSTLIHLGNAVPLRKLAKFQQAGHEVVFLVGSFTAMIGDTSDKDAMRQPLTAEQVEKNFQTYKAQASKILDFSKAKIVYNADWLSDLSFQNVIELAQHFTVQQMIQREMYQKRISEDKPIGLHEFFYPLMQGYDSVHLEVDLEIGGNDQLFNMMAGRTLLKDYKNKEKYVMTTPLLEGTDGRKMSKSYGNTINIDDTPTEMFGKLMSMKDELIVKYMLLTTDMPIKEIDEADKAMKAGANPKDFKVRLATEVLTMYHGADAAAQAVDEFANIFKKGGTPDEMPEFKMSGDRNVIDLLELCKLIATRAEGKRLVEQGGLEIDGERVTDKNAVIHLKAGMVIKAGKRKFAKII